MWHAWVDESEQTGTDERVRSYVLGSAICAPADAEQLRRTVGQLRLPGQRRLHWHTESPVRRRRLVAAATSLSGVEYMIVVREADRQERPERSRRLCSERMLFELEALKVERIFLESRERKQNQQDRRLVDGLRARRIVPPHLRVDHLPGPSDPMLWLPDLLCGAFGTTGMLRSPTEADNSSPWAAFATRTTIHRVRS